MPALSLEIIGVPFDWGASKRGARVGPDAVRALGLMEQLRALGLQVTDGGNVALPRTDPGGDPPRNLNHWPEVRSMALAVAERIENALMEDRLPVVIGGDHSLALGTIAGAARVVSPLGLLWIDAHGDFNDDTTSPSGNIHGMPFSSVLGLGPALLNELAGPSPKVRPEHAALIGVRDLDKAEAPKLAASGVRAYGIDEIRSRGFGTILAEAIAIVTNGTAGFHCSFDIDALDPAAMPGTGTRAANGLSLEEGTAILQTSIRSGHCRSLDITELNPLLDAEGITVRRTIDLLLAAFVS